ncbi:MAG: hypothetical protein GF375_03440 [Candidatus Omnitrophica bacterium]|nr:hypothetical protein [Candidatus Omnitrophota bacterium]MBD3269128.1 hypothetical protein [Candidatus Omnitrophota bacterium]
MRKIPKEIVNFFHQQKFIIVSTFDSQGYIHCSAKGLVNIHPEGKLYIIDLYKRNTFSNLKKNSRISVTAIDEKKFMGYNLKGEGRIVKKESIEEVLIKKWEEKVIQRISKRVIRNIRKDKGSKIHPEALFPHPEYLIEMTVRQIIDLAPSHLKLREKTSPDTK